MHIAHINPSSAVASHTFFRTRTQRNENNFAHLHSDFCTRLYTQSCTRTCLCNFTVLRKTEKSQTLCKFILKTLQGLWPFCNVASNPVWWSMFGMIGHTMLKKISQAMKDDKKKSEKRERYGCFFDFTIFLKRHGVFGFL